MSYWPIFVIGLRYHSEYIDKEGVDYDDVYGKMNKTWAWVGYLCNGMPQVGWQFSWVPMGNESCQPNQREAYSRTVTHRLQYCICSVLSIAPAPNANERWGLTLNIIYR